MFRLSIITTVCLSPACLDGWDTSAPKGTNEDTAPPEDTDSSLSLPVSCKELLASNPSAASGLHPLDPAQDGSSVDAWCDMDFDGGGWTRVLGVEIDDVTPTSLTDLGIALGLEAAAIGDGGMSTSALNDLRDLVGFSALRFECEKVDPGRKVHIITDNEDVLDYFTSRTDAEPEAEGTYTVAADSSSYLPGLPDRWGCTNGCDSDEDYQHNTWGHDWAGDDPDQRLRNHPFFVLASYHWNVLTEAESWEGGRFECDDVTTETSTRAGVWSIWVR